MFHNRQTQIPDNIALQLGGCEIPGASSVKNLGVIFDPHLNRERHVSEVVRICNYALNRLSRIRMYIDKDACKRAVHGLVLSRLDYCNSILADLPVALLDKLQKLQNRAARLVLRPKRGFNVIIHTGPLLQELSWLPVRLRITFKICCLVFKCVQGRAPQYLCELISVHSRPIRLRQSTATYLTVPRTTRRIGSSSFSVMGPTLWNKLPPRPQELD